MGRNWRTQRLFTREAAKSNYRSGLLKRSCAMGVECGHSITEKKAGGHQSTGSATSSTWKWRIAKLYRHKWRVWEQETVNGIPSQKITRKPNTFKGAASAVRAMLVSLCDGKSVNHSGFLPTATNINCDLCCEIRTELKAVFRTVLPRMQQHFLLHDNVGERKSCRHSTPWCHHRVASVWCRRSFISFPKKKKHLKWRHIVRTMKSRLRLRCWSVMKLQSYVEMGLWNCWKIGDGANMVVWAMTGQRWTVNFQ